MKYFYSFFAFINLNVKITFTIFILNASLTSAVRSQPLDLGESIVTPRQSNDNDDKVVNKSSPGDIDVYLFSDTTCINIISDTTYCDSTGTYIYEFQVFNNSPTKYIEQLEIAIDSPQPPNYVVAVPSTINVTPNLPPLTASRFYKVKLTGPGAVAFSEVCYTLSVHYLHDDCPWCCFIENCIKLPICSCAEVVRDSLYCVNGDYFYNFDLKNGTQYNVTKIQLTSPGTSIAFVPQIFHFNTPIAPGQTFPNLTAQILGGVVGMPLPVKIKLFSGNFECCYIELDYELPPCICDSALICARTICPDDPITVSLARSVSPFDILFSETLTLDDNGCAYYNFPDAVEGTSYYIVLNSYRSLETWSAMPHIIKGATCLEYDFTTGPEKAYGNNMQEVNGIWVMLSGDINQDGSIDMSDLLAVWNASNNQQKGGIEDLNCDGFVDLQDVLIAYNNLLNFAQVMKP